MAFSLTDLWKSGKIYIWIGIYFTLDGSDVARMHNMKKSELGKLLVDYTESLEKESGASEFDETNETAPLFETVRTLSSVMQPKQPSEEFSARIFQAVQAKASGEEFQEKVAMEKKNSAEKIRKIIAMAVTDESFRKGFFHDVVTACRNAGFDLTPQEAAALRNLKEDAVENFANSLDERITKFFPTTLP